MKSVKCEEAVKLIEESSGRFFTVLFKKRSTGELRKMNCRINVKKYLRGGNAPYDFKQKMLIPVWSVDANGYRSIPMEGLRELFINKEKYNVK